MGIWVGFGGLFQLVHHVRSVFEILGGVENDLFFRFLLLLLLLFSFLFGFLFSLFSSQTLLLLESFLFIFAQLSITAFDDFSFLDLNWFVLDNWLGLLLSRLLLIWILLHFGDIKEKNEGN